MNLQIQNDTYKILHEEFVSHHSGTSAWELVAVVLPWTFSTFIMQLTHSSRFFFTKSRLFMTFFEFCLTVIPQLIILTLAADYIIPLLTSLIIIATSLVVLKIILTSFRGSETWPKDIWNAIVVSPESTQFSFIGNTRTHLCILTCISILAVDFPIYPRRFAKTETFGYGLMDTGVGFFMIINGYVAPEAKTKYDFSKRTAALKKSLLTSIPLAVLGVIRVISVKMMNYQEHVTEYGVHWNFFFSLAAAKIGSSLVFTFFPPAWTGLVAVLLTIFYQVLLQLGLRDIVFHGIDGTDSRSNFLDANREGLSSCIGFTCLYLAGVQFGYVVYRAGLSLKSWVKTAGFIGTSIGVLTLLTIASHFWIEPASRRLVNMTYILYLTTFMYFLTWIWLCLDLVDVVLKYFCGPFNDKYVAAEPPLISMSMSYNFLLTFLVANIFTGIVNVSITTIYASKVTSFSVLAGYSFALSVVMVGCYVKKYQMKFF